MQASLSWCTDAGTQKLSATSVLRCAEQGPGTLKTVAACKIAQGFLPALGQQKKTEEEEPLVG